jgi:hypothetical protein
VRDNVAQIKVLDIVIHYFSSIPDLSVSFLRAFSHTFSTA